VRAPKTGVVDDAFAEQLGMGDLEALTTAIRNQLAQQYQGASRFKLKRALLDELDKAHDFPLPPRMVDAEFETIWRQVSEDKEKGSLAEDDAEKSEEQLRAEYRKIAERRVRLGLVLAEIGRRDNVAVTDAELNQALIAEARKYPGQEKQVFDFFRSNPQAAAQLRAPVYEEKVVDLIVCQGAVAVERSQDALLAEDVMLKATRSCCPPHRPIDRALGRAGRWPTRDTATDCRRLGLRCCRDRVSRSRCDFSSAHAAISFKALTARRVSSTSRGAGSHREYVKPERAHSRSGLPRRNHTSSS
jgi:hypothetical protein